MSTVTIYDTTLRDGTQGTGISYSTLDKLRVAEKLDDFGVHYIEGGWPGSNPKDKEVHGDHQLQEPDGHNIALLWADFIEAIESKRKPVADIEEAHRSSCLPMLGMLSWKAGRSIQWDAAKEQIIGDAEASKLLRREYRGPWVYPEA